MRYGSGMTKTIDTVTITATEQDRVTLEGIAEFERGEFIGIEEWRRELDELKADLRTERGR